MRKGILVGMAALLAVSAFAHAGTIAPPAGATAVFSDDFEGYANIAAVKTVWSQNAASSAALYAGAGKNGSQGIQSSGSTTGYLAYALPNLKLDDKAPIVVEVDMWDWADMTTGTPVIASREGIDVRNSGASAVYAMAVYNTNDDWSKYPLAGTGKPGYGFRNSVALNGPGSSGGWWLINGTRVTSADPSLAYHHYKMVLGSSSSRFELTMANGWKYTKVIAQKADSYGKTLNSMRLGLTSSTVGKVLYDNVQVYTIPEPASMLLLGLGGLLLRRRRA